MTIELLKQSKELLMAVADLANILDQPIGDNGLITLRYIDASQLINSALLNAREMVSEIETELLNLNQ